MFPQVSRGSLVTIATCDRLSGSAVSDPATATARRSGRAGTKANTSCCQPADTCHVPTTTAAWARLNVAAATTASSRRPSAA